jgi:hypothetical protein
MRVFVAILLGGLTSAMYALSTSLQALEARRTSTQEALRASLLETLVRRRLWVLGTVCGLVAWPLQAIALSLASVAITASVVVLGWAAPPETGSFTRGGQVVVLVLVAVAAAGPYLLRALGRADGMPTSIAAGIGWAAVGLATALIDDGLAGRHWTGVLLWGAAAAAAGWSGLLSEMTALQTWPATRAIPVVFGLEMALPAAVTPLITSNGPTHAVAFVAALAAALGGAIVLGSSRAVARAATSGEET